MYLRLQTLGYFRYLAVGELETSHSFRGTRMASQQFFEMRGVRWYVEELTYIYIYQQQIETSKLLCKTEVKSSLLKRFNTGRP